MLRLTSNDLQQRTDESVAHARAARERGAQFFQFYLPLGDPPLERWLVADEQTRLVEAVEAEGWALEGIGYAGEPLRDSFYSVTATCGVTVAAIYTFRAAELMRRSRIATNVSRPARGRELSLPPPGERLNMLQADSWAGRRRRLLRRLLPVLLVWLLPALVVVASAYAVSRG